MRWLYLLAKLGLGACLADDMGLGKTIQVLSLLLVLRNQNRRPTATKSSGCARFASRQLGVGTGALRAEFECAHRPSVGAACRRSYDPRAGRLQDVDLVITSYGSLLRVPWIADASWRLVVIDEAQAIKNPDAKQTRIAKKLKAQAKFALTGTPVENRLGDLWSIFDFMNPGLLGSSKEFSNFVKRLEGRPHNPYGPLRELVRPYILRRLKTDKTVIADLPDKTEVKAFCQLSRKQAALYKQAVEELAEALDGSRWHPSQRSGTVIPDAVQADLQPSVAVAG